MDSDDLIQKFMDPGYTYTYKECNRRGHEWEQLPVEWFPFGWRLPWVRRNKFKRCTGCGICQLISYPRAWVWPKFRE